MYNSCIIICCCRETIYREFTRKSFHSSAIFNYFSINLIIRNFTTQPCDARAQKLSAKSIFKQINCRLCLNKKNAENKMWMGFEPLCQTCEKAPQLAHKDHHLSTKSQHRSSQNVPYPMCISKCNESPIPASQK